MFSRHPGPFDGADSSFSPSENDLKEISAHIALTQAKIAAIDAQIAPDRFTLDMDLWAMYNERDALQAQIEHYKSFFSPIYRVPTDVLLEIFLAFRDLDAGMIWSQPPMLLRRVCRYWRNLTLRSPELWKHIDMSMDAASCSRLDVADGRARVALSQALDECFARAGPARPLSLVYRGPSVHNRHTTYPDNDHLHALRIVERILDARHRLRSLTLASKLQPFQDVLAGPVPSLRHIDLRFDDLPQSTDGILTSPSLKSISLVASCELRGLLLSSPWSRLTELRLVTVPRRAAVASVPAPVATAVCAAMDQIGAAELLRLCPNLVRCHLTIYAAMQTFPIQQTTLPHLEELLLMPLPPYQLATQNFANPHAPPGILGIPFHQGGAHQHFFAAPGIGNVSVLGQEINLENPAIELLHSLVLPRLRRLALGGSSWMDSDRFWDTSVPHSGLAVYVAASGFRGANASLLGVFRLFPHATHIYLGNTSAPTATVYGPSSAPVQLRRDDAGLRAVWSLPSGVFHSWEEEKLCPFLEDFYVKVPAFSGSEDCADDIAKIESGLVAFHVGIPHASAGGRDRATFGGCGQCLG
ncbi:F-box domain-containing protein [Mycena kentingensis (nom. inval.)]|nr:F-box domain-containing protein [Mycena kentingensis (nom. inval.)]